MKKHASAPRAWTSAVSRVAHKWVPTMAQMSTDLVEPACVQGHLDKANNLQVGTDKVAHHGHLRARRPPRIRDDAPEAVRRPHRLLEFRLQELRSGRHPAVAKAHIPFMHPPGCKLHPRRVIATVIASPEKSS